MTWREVLGRLDAWRRRDALERELAADFSRISISSPATRRRPVCHPRRHDTRRVDSWAT